MNRSCIYEIAVVSAFVVLAFQNARAGNIQMDGRAAIVMQIDDLNRKAAEGDYNAAQELRILWRKGVGKAIDYVNVYALQERVEKDPNDTDALCRLGQAYLYERGCVNRDLDRARRCLYASAERGNQDAMWELGVMNCWTIDGVKQDLPEAEKWFKKLDSMDDDRACFALGWIGMYSDGKDINETIAYMEKSMARGHPRGALHLGIIYSEGQQVQADQDKAFDYFTQAVDMGSPEAAYFAAAYYYKTPLNDGNFKKDKKKAIHLLEYALREGDDSTRDRILSDFDEDTSSTNRSNTQNHARREQGSKNYREALLDEESAELFFEHVSIRGKQRKNASRSDK